MEDTLCCLYETTKHVEVCSLENEFSSSSERVLFGRMHVTFWQLQFWLINVSLNVIQMQSLWY